MLPYPLIRIPNKSNFIFLKNQFKNLISSKLILALFVGLFSFLSSGKLYAQTQLELSSGSMGSIGNGATISSQTATKLENTSGSTFVSFSPTTTVTATFSNQQFTSIPTGIITTGTGMMYGATANSFATSAISRPVFNTINSIASPANANFTSNPNGTPGTGIDVGVNHGFYFYNSVYPLFVNSSSLTGRFYYGDVTFTFNRPVSDPVLHISGLGGNINFGGTNIQGFSTELELQGSGITASKISGTSEFTVASNVISNSASTLSFGCGAGAACGSIKLAGTNITSVTLRMFVKGDG